MAENNKKMVANAEFEQEKSVGINIDQLSYICDYCGKVNQIGAPRCVRCGKRRPRSEYINAMTKIKTAKTVKTQYLEEQSKVEAEKKDAAQQQIVRLVESRVEDEKQSIYAQENLRVEQEREAIKKSTARDAVLRIIAAERAAEDKIKEAEARAEDAVRGRSLEVDGIIEEEKRKVLEVAAQKVVAARAGIEEAAREQIEANKKIADKYVNETLYQEKDKAERNAARRAVLQIIAAEKAADEKVKSTKDALQQAAVERIVEERILADKEASSRYLAEKQAIERAADERIKAEKETLKKLLEDKQSTYSGGNTSYTPYGGGMQQGAIQPLTIVPYVNPNHPVYQYKPNQVYKFVPNQIAPQNVDINSKQIKNKAQNLSIDGNSSEKKVKKGCKKVKILSIFCLIFSIAILLLALLPIQILPASNLPNIADIANIANLSGMAMISTIAFFAFLGFTALSLIQNLIRLISGKAAKLGFIIPLIAVVLMGVALYGFGFIVNTIIFATIACLLLLFTIIGGLKSKKA